MSCICANLLLVLDKMTCNGDDKDWSPKWKECFLHELTARPKTMTEVRRDGKDDAVISKVIAAELDRRLGGQTEDKKKVSRNLKVSIVSFNSNPL